LPVESYPMAEIRTTNISDVLVVTPTVHSDDRGSFQETYRREWFPLGREMIQGSKSEKTAGSLVGMHYHLRQADYWFVVRGRCSVVLLDLREDSRSKGEVFCLEIGEDNQEGIFIPPGVAHGFAAITDMTLTYLVDQYYNPSDELGVAWNDPKLADIWPISDPVISDRDSHNPLIADIPDHLRPRGVLRT
jgi:dTDP-4-dehydrorhamnose 3,5-epimerase